MFTHNSKYIRLFLNNKGEDLTHIYSRNYPISQFVYAIMEYYVNTSVANRHIQIEIDQEFIYVVYFDNNFLRDVSFSVHYNGGTNDAF